MEKLKVRIVKLEPMRVASFYAHGASPETEALKKLFDWAGPKGLLSTSGKHRVFGFNNPDPSPGSPNYGYEFWIVIGDMIKPEKKITVKDFPGGLYGVARCEVKGDPYQSIPVTWQKLSAWRADSNYTPANHQWLEEMLGEVNPAAEDMTLDLYIPIKE